MEVTDEVDVYKKLAEHTEEVEYSLPMLMYKTKVGVQ